jgi:hypothetical protein
VHSILHRDERDPFRATLRPISHAILHHYASSLLFSSLLSSPLLSSPLLFSSLLSSPLLFSSLLFSSLLFSPLLFSSTLGLYDGSWTRDSARPYRLQLHWLIVLSLSHSQLSALCSLLLAPFFDNPGGLSPKQHPLTAMSLIVR